jgi:hypothetical protein
VSLERLLRVLTDALDAAGIPSMLTGSLAAAFRGASRATMDVDLVIDPTAAALDDFVRPVKSRALVGRRRARRAAGRAGTVQRDLRRDRAPDSRPARRRAARHAERRSVRGQPGRRGISHPVSRPYLDR